MQSARSGEILAPHDRWGRGGRWFGDERLQWLENLLDEAFVIPGTKIRFGVDGIIGLVPGIGDVLAGLLSLLIPLAAWMRGVPYVTIARMLLNVTIGLIVGSVPFLGDAFDIFWKANRRNYRLLTRSISEPRKHVWQDWVFLVIFGSFIAVVFMIPILLLVWLLVRVNSWQPFPG
jgi:hypothetical protein